MSLIFIPRCVKIKTLTLKTTVFLYEKNTCFLGNVPQTFISKKKISCHLLPLAASQKHTQAWRPASSGWSADGDITFLVLLWKPFCRFFIRGKSNPQLTRPPPSYFTSSVFQEAALVFATQLSHTRSQFLSSRPPAAPTLRFTPDTTIKAKLEFLVSQMELGLFGAVCRDRMTSVIISSCHRACLEGFIPSFFFFIVLGAALLS